MSWFDGMAAALKALAAFLRDAMLVWVGYQQAKGKEAQDEVDAAKRAGDAVDAYKDALARGDRAAIERMRDQFR